MPMGPRKDKHTPVTGEAEAWKWKRKQKRKRIS